MHIRKFKNSGLIIGALFVGITCLFFYKTLLFGQIPFPGDILIAEYSPWKYSTFLGYNPGSFPNKAQYFDVIRQLYPWKVFAVDQMQSFAFPLWNPYNFSGAPLLANIQSSPFNLSNIAFLLLPKAGAWTLYIVLQPFLMLIFTFLYLRSITLSRKAAIFGAVAFSFSLFNTVFLEYGTYGHSVMWMPLALFLVEKSLKKITVSSLLLAPVIAFTAFAGHLQLFGYIFLFTLFYSVFRAWQLRMEWKRLSAIVAFTFLGIGIAAIQLLPTVELVQLSARTPHDYAALISNFLLQPTQLFLFFIPDLFGNPVTRNYLLNDSYPGNALYIGAAGIVLAFYGLYTAKRNHVVGVYLIAITVLLFLFIRTPVSEVLYSLSIPIINASSPSNAFFLLAFSLSVLSGFGLDALLTDKAKRILPTVLVSCILIFVWGLSLLGMEVSMKNLLFSTVVTFVALSVVLSALFLSRKFIFLLFPILVFDLLFFFIRFNPFVSPELLFPRTEISESVTDMAGVDRVYGYGAAHIESNFQTELEFYSAEGYDPLYPLYYGAFIKTSEDGALTENFNNTSRSNAVLAPGFGGESFGDNHYRNRVFNILGIRYILDRPESQSSDATFPQDQFKNIHESDGWTIYERLDAYPRYFLANSYELYEAPDEFSDKFFNPAFDPRHTLLVESDGLIPVDSESEGAVELISYSPNEIRFQTETTGDMLLFLSDTYYPGWKAYVDGEQRHVLKTHYAFRSVSVPSGNHAVMFRYEPVSFANGSKVTIMSLGILVVLFLFIRYGIYKKIQK